MNLRLVGLIGCTGKKAEVQKPVPAHELYRSNFFKNSLRFAEQYCQYIYILSPQYGLLEPKRSVLPYDRKITDLCPGERHAWVIKVVRDLHKRMSKPNGYKENTPYQVLLLAGTDYGDLLREELLWNRVPTCYPIQGLSRCESLRWLTLYRPPKKKRLFA
jgi:hypothetical protein